MLKLKMCRGWLFVMAAGLAAVAPAAAQSRATTADLTGVVLDESKAVLPGATVTATNAATNLARTVVTGADGRFMIPALPPGSYTVRAELPAFAPQAAENIVLNLGALVDLEFSLKVAGAQEQITVIAEAPVVDTQKTVVSSVVSQQQIESLPINGRNFIAFSVITPGVTTDRTPQQGASGTSGLSFGGQRARSNNITVDGLDNNDSTVGAVRATFSQEAVREFQVLTSSYSAEFGKASGGVVNIVTKSGTNTVDGNAFFFFRDEALNAKEHFEQVDPAGRAIDRDKAPYSQKQFGATLGGPLKKDRSFFFASFERLDIDANNFVTIDDRTLVPHPLVPGGTLGTPARILRGAGFPVETGNVPYAIESSQFLAKVDHQINQNNNLSIRFNWADALNENIEPFGGIVARSRAAVLDSKDFMGAASYTSVLSAKAVNELRFQVANREQAVNSLDSTCGGPCVREDQGGPTLEVTGVASVGRQRFTPQPRENVRYQVLDTISFYASSHHFKAGLDFNYIDNKNQSLPLHFGGRFIFAALPALPPLGIPVPLSAIQAVALGVPAAYVQGYGNSAAPYKYKDISLFAQDDWRVGSRVTVKLGVRYQNQFWPDTSYNVAGYPGTYTFPRDSNNVAPRLGFAWDPMGDRKTSIHGAYGIFFDNHITGIVGIADAIDGESGVRTLVAALPGSTASIAAWRSPGHRLSEAAARALFGGSFPSLEISIDPGLKTPYAHHVAAGVDRQLPGQLSLAANIVYVRGRNQLGTIDYNPVVRALLPVRARPEDIAGRPGSSASVLQYTSFGETSYRGMTLSVTKRFSNRSQFLASYTLSKAEDNSTDFQSAFIPQENGRGRNPADLNGLPIGFTPDDEKGPATHDQRHRFVASGLYVFPGDVHLSSIVTVGSGRPYNILAGADLNGDGNGGAFPPDRARRNPLDQGSSVGRNSGTMPYQATVDLRVSKRIPLGGGASLDGIFEVFNLFDRTNFTEVNNIFGPGSYPGSQLPTFGLFDQAGPPRQVQLAVKLNF